MAARDRYAFEVVCPKCRQIGVFHVSEDDHPYIRNPHRSVNKIDGNFLATVKSGVDVEAVCQQYNTVFTP